MTFIVGGAIGVLKDGHYYTSIVNVHFIMVDEAQQELSDHK